MLENDVIPGLQEWGQTPLSYTGPSYLGPNANITGGQGSQLGFAGGQGQQGINNALGAWQNSLDPNQALNAEGAFNPLQNYAFETGRALDENIRPGYASGAASAGQHGGYSSERHQGDLRAQRDASEAISRFGGQLTGQLANQGLQNSLAAQGMTGQMFGAGMMPGQVQQQIGDQQRGEQYAEQGMNNAETQFNQMEPYQRLSMLNSQMMPMANAFGESNTTSVEPGKKTNWLGTGLGLAGTVLGGMYGGPIGAQAGSMFGNMVGGNSPPSVSGSPFQATASNGGGFGDYGSGAMGYQGPTSRWF